MKLFLTTSIVAMIAAGIFGVYDFSKDVKEGNYIVYEQEDESSNATSFNTERNSKAVTLTNVVSAVNESFTANTKKVIKEEYFSRGEPIEVSDIVVEEKAPEKVEVKETVKAPAVRSDKPEKRKFSYKLYSRGTPPRIADEEVDVVAEVDSTKKD